MCIAHISYTRNVPMAENIVRVRPTPSNAYLGNPHKGICTFQHFNGDVSSSTSNVVHSSQLFHFARTCSSKEDFNKSNEIIFVETGIWIF